MSRPAPSSIAAGIAASLFIAGAVAAVGGLRTVSRRRSTGESFRDRVVVITGGARGLGLAIARVFAAEGARLVLLSRTPAELERVVPELQALGADASTMMCDIRRQAAVREAVDQIIGMAGRIDVLVNNAGIIQCMPFENAQIDDFED